MVTISSFNLVNFLGICFNRSEQLHYMCMCQLKIWFYGEKLCTVNCLSVILFSPHQKVAWLRPQLSHVALQVGKAGNLDEYLKASPLSISLRSMYGWGGSAVTLEKQAAHRNDCVIIAVIQSGPHARVESRSGVPDQCWPDWRKMRCWPVGTRWPCSSCRGLPQQHHVLWLCRGKYSCRCVICSYPNLHLLV